MQVLAIDELPGRQDLAGDADRSRPAPDVAVAPEAEELVLVVRPVQPDRATAHIGPVIGAGEDVDEVAVEQRSELLDHSGPARRPNRSVVNCIQRSC
jgi:hypothetical protein